MNRCRRSACHALFAGATAVGGAARAQTYTVDAVTPWSIGTVAAAASGTTVFLNSTIGTVQVISGSGSVLSGPYAFETVSIRCVDQGAALCSNTNNKARIQVGRTGVNTGRAQTITALGVDSGTGTIGAGTTQSNATLDFQFSGWTASNQVQTFKIGAFLPISGDDGTGSTGAASSGFYVYAAKYPNTPTTGLGGTITGTVRRALVLTKTADLAFGTIVVPAYADAFLSINTDDSRSTSNGYGSLTLVPSTYHAAHFTITGEPGTTFTLSYPNNFNMTGPGGATLGVSVSPQAPGGGVTIPANGSTTYAIGGYFQVIHQTPTGNYTGSFTVTIAYN